jgi:hypothetical protein
LGGFGAKPGSRKPYGNPGEVFPALGFAAHFNMICKDKTLWLLGILQLIFLNKTLIRCNNFAITTGCDCLN